MQIQFCNSNCESNLTLTIFCRFSYIYSVLLYKKKDSFFQLEAKCAIIHRLLNLFHAYEGLPKLIKFQQSKTQQTTTILIQTYFSKGSFDSTYCGKQKKNFVWK